MRTKAVILLFTVLPVFFMHAPVQAQQAIREIVRKVQANSQKSYDSIDSVAFKAYSKMYVYFGYHPLRIKLVPYLEEYYVDGYWLKPDSVRYCVRAVREIDITDDTTRSGSDKIFFGMKDFLPLPNPFQFTYDPSAFRLNVPDSLKDLARLVKKPVYPFARGADSLYSYKLLSEVGVDYRKILEIQVAPKNPSVPAVVGTFRVDPVDYVVVGSDVVFNDAASFTKSRVSKGENSVTLSLTGSENRRVRTKKALLYSAYWLPENIIEEFEMKFMGVKIKVFREITFSSYRVNPAAPDTSVAVNQGIIYDRNPGFEARVFEKPEYPGRLSHEEEERIIKTVEDRMAAFDLDKELLSSDMLAKAAENLGVDEQKRKYARLVKKLGGMSRFDRVEGFRAAYGATWSPPRIGGAAFSFQAGYGFSDKRKKLEAGAVCFLGAKKRFFIEGNLYDAIGFEEDRQRISTTANTYMCFLANTDYRDYYYVRGGSVGIGVRARDNLAFRFTYLTQSEEPAVNRTKFSLFKPKTPYRLNPGIIAGYYRGIRAGMIYRSYRIHADLTAEHTDPGMLHSDFSYSRVRARFNWQYRPTFNGRFFFGLEAGASDGRLPPQRLFDFGGKIFLDYSGNLRGVRYKAFTGDRMIAATVEYSIKSRALNRLGLKIPIINAYKHTFWAGLGWSELAGGNRNYAAGVMTPLQTTDGVYHEFGAGIGDSLNIFRLDFVWNSISRNAVLVSFNLLR